MTLHHVKGTLQIGGTAHACLYGPLFTQIHHNVPKQTVLTAKVSCQEPVRREVAACSVCRATVMQGFIGNERCESSMNRRPGQVCVCVCAHYHKRTVLFVAVNNSA